MNALSLSSIYPNPDQPRKDFDPEKLEELSISIKQYGVLEPILVTPRENRYMIVSGERRYRASLLAGLQTIPARIIEADDALVEELALLENVQRQDLNVIEEAKAYQALLDRGWSKEDLATKMGFKQVWRIEEKISYLKLAPKFRRMVIDGTISNLQALWMARVNSDKQTLIFKKITRGELNTLNKLRSFVEGLILVENQEAIFSFQTITEEERKSIEDLSALLRSVERFITATQNTTADHLKKAAFHSAHITPERIELIIQQLMRIRKLILAGAGFKDAMAA